MTLVVEGLGKAYGPKRVLDSVDLTVVNGEIHALLGPNGSGKSTLISCLSGAVVPDAGSVHVDDVALTHVSPRQAIEAGVAVIYQHFSLVNTLTVAENIFLGAELRVRGRVDRATQRDAAAQLLAPFERPIEPDTRVGDLRVGDRQLVEVAKALHRRPRVLVLDEPTAALGDQETARLGRHLKRLRDDGLAILYVTHIIDEVFAIGDSATVIRDGRVVLAARVADIDPRQVIAAISPPVASDDTQGREDQPQPLNATALAVDGLAVDGIGPVDLSVAKGEIVAIFGLLGSGRTELLEGIFGARRILAGRFEVHGQPYEPRSPSHALKTGIALVAGDRLSQSMFDKMSSLDNVMLPHFHRLARRGARRKGAELSLFHRVADRLGLQPQEPSLRAWAFSGGNQQKLAVGRWLASGEAMGILLLDEPTQGIDVGARADLYRILKDLTREEGKAIIFTSSDPEETIALADRIVVIRRGQTVAELSRRDCDEQSILALAHGAGEAVARESRTTSEVASG